MGRVHRKGLRIGSKGASAVGQRIPEGKLAIVDGVIEQEGLRGIIAVNIIQAGEIARTLANHMKENEHQQNAEQDGNRQSYGTAPLHEASPGKA